MNNVVTIKNEEEAACPFCGTKDFQVTASHAACIDVTPIVRDGVIINRCPDGIEKICLCNACGHVFSYKTKQVVQSQEKEERVETPLTSEEKKEPTPKTTVRKRKIKTTQEK